jgi:hypothetical protein
LSNYRAPECQKHFVGALLAASVKGSVSRCRGARGLLPAGSLR